MSGMGHCTAGSPKLLLSECHRGGMSAAGLCESSSRGFSRSARRAAEILHQREPGREPIKMAMPALIS